MAQDLNLYSTILSTAQTFMQALRPRPGTNEADKSLILSTCAESFLMDWGHSFFVSTMPGLQGLKNPQEFLDHMKPLSGKLETWTIDLKDTIVDVEKRKVVVRADFGMKVRESEGPILNDIVFIFEMDEEGKKLVRGTEFLDPIASQEIRKRVVALGEK